jgi:predicted Zn-dependent protease
MARCAWLLVVCLAVTFGCVPQAPPGEGPGHRPQELGLSPEQEYALGRQAYREILREAEVLPIADPRVQRLERVGRRIAHACEIEPLMREINLQLEAYRFDWEFHVIDDDRINAFCLPGGKVMAFTGLFAVADDDDMLATVVGHEVAHVLAHHASERVAWQYGDLAGLRAVGFELDRLPLGRRQHLIQMFAPGFGGLSGLSYQRRQELEADHIGVFLMTFAGYDPQAAAAFWERMQAIAARRGELPEILSDHPSPARRMAQLRGWIALASGAKAAYDAGQVESSDRGR